MSDGLESTHSLQNKILILAIPGGRAGAGQELD
jgi:hypothetical protein